MKETNPAFEKHYAVAHRKYHILKHPVVASIVNQRHAVVMQRHSLHEMCYDRLGVGRVQPDSSKPLLAQSIVGRSVKFLG